MPNIVVIGATRGLGHNLVSLYAKQSNTTVWGTSRKDSPPDEQDSIKWITKVDVGTPSAGPTVASGLPSGVKIDTLIVSAGFFGTESFEKPSWEDQEKMYRTSAIGPVFIVTSLVESGHLTKGSKVVMVSSEAGSIKLRYGAGGDYGHHGSKAALNMIMNLLSWDVKEKEIALCSVHPGFMRTEMTKNVGFDKAWDSGGGELFHYKLCLWY
jgi:short-subunit dehydrogenase